MSSRSRHAVSRESERRLGRLLPACATNHHLLTKMLMFASKELDDINGEDIDVWPASLPVQLGIRLINHISNGHMYTLRVEDLRHKLLSYRYLHCASTSDVAPAS